jgi:uncharacterized protein (TIGR03435 family)
MIRVFIAILASCGAFGQAAFEVASVKPADPASRQGVDFRITDGILRATNVTVVNLITQAYSLKHYELAGGAGWLRSDRFDVEAKAEGDPGRVQVLAMLQTLLAERFQLKVHREDREQSIYALVAAKRGSKLAEPKEDDLPPAVRISFTGSSSEKKTYVLSGHKASLALLAEKLGDAERPVLDRSGIPGAFDFRLEYAADDTKPEYGASLFTAIQEQLGLKLESGKGPISTLVIDHAEKLRAN